MRHPLGPVAACIVALAPGLAAAQDAPAAETAPTALLAEAPPPAVEWHLSGFATVGINHLQSEPGWRFVRASNQPRARSTTDLGNDTRLGVQMNGLMPHGLELTVQLIAKRMSPAESLAKRIEQANLAWRPNDHLTVRVGRYAPDAFLLAEYRNVGFSYPWVRPDSDFYGWMPAAPLDGIDTRYQWLTEDDVQWQVRGWAGRWRGLLAAYRDLTHVDTRQRGLGVSRQVGPWTLKATLVSVKNTMSSPLDTVDPIIKGALETVAALPVSREVAGEASGLLRDYPDSTSRIRYMGLGLLYDGAAWLGHAELSRTPGSYVGMGGLRGYASLGWRHHALIWFGKASLSRPLDAVRHADAARWASELTPLVGADSAAQLARTGQVGAAVINAARFDGRTIGAGVRWDVDGQTALKFQVDRFHTAANGGAAWDQLSLQRPVRSTLWSVSLDKVF